MVSGVGQWEGFDLVVGFIVGFFIEVVSWAFVNLVITIVLAPIVIQAFRLSYSILPIPPSSYHLSLPFPPPPPHPPAPAARTSYTTRSVHKPYSKYP